MWRQRNKKMKKIILIALIAFVSNVKAQFTLEHTYDNAATYNNCSGNLNQLMIINFEVSGERYVKINRCGGLISIYNMNHSLVKDISIVALPHEPYDNIGSILYLSEHLFNLDSKIEFLYVSRLGSFYTTNIYNEDGDLLFTAIVKNNT